jgi:hypothetical protein
MSAEPLEKRILEACREDHVGLWEFIRIVSRQVEPQRVRQVTLGLIGKLLEEGRIRAGEPTRDGRAFVPWNLSPGESVSRIEFEWRKLRRDPHLGEIVWFEEAPD